ncbi:hypothetical protein SAMN04487925_105148 [Bradyrhizobium sp. cf659]|nr:hypothetical protein SAMN04487925_105148 [Bradyrhizobium sp. cf659]
MLSCHDSRAAPQIAQTGSPVCGTKNLSSVRLYSAPQVHCTIVTILKICASNPGISSPGNSDSLSRELGVALLHRRARSVPRAIRMVLTDPADVFANCALHAKDLSKARRAYIDAKVHPDSRTSLGLRRNTALAAAAEAQRRQNRVEVEAKLVHSGHARPTCASRSATLGLEAHGSDRHRGGEQPRADALPAKCRYRRNSQGCGRRSKKPIATGVDCRTKERSFARRPLLVDGLGAMTASGPRHCRARTRCDPAPASGHPNHVRPEQP